MVLKAASHPGTMLPSPTTYDFLWFVQARVEKKRKILEMQFVMECLAMNFVSYLSKNSKES